MKTKLLPILFAASIASAQTTNTLYPLSTNITMEYFQETTLTTNTQTGVRYKTNIVYGAINTNGWFYNNTNSPSAASQTTNAPTQFQTISYSVPGNGVYAPVYQFNGVYFTNMAMLTTNAFGQGNIDLSVPVGSSNWTYYTVTNQ